MLDKRERVGLSRSSPASPVFWVWAVLCAKRGNLIFGSEGGDFDAVRVLPDLAGYRVHNGDHGYNYGDEFAPDWAAIEKREKIAAECDRLEYAARKRDIENGKRKWVNSSYGRIFTNGGFYVDPERLGVLHWRLFDGEAAGDHEIDINAGETAAECIRAAMSWNAATYGDFSAAI